MGLLILLTGIWFFLFRGFEAKSKYKDGLAKIKSLGEPTTFTELNTWHKAVPAEKNPALAYQQTSNSIPANIDELRREEQKAYAKWRRAANYNPSTLRIPQTLLPAMRGHLVGQKTHIDQLLKFYSTFPANEPARFPLNWNDGEQVLLPHLSKIKADSGVLIYRSRYYADAGYAGLNEAIRSILVAHRLAHLLNGEPTLISVLVQRSVYTNADAQIERLLNQFALNDMQLLTIQKSVASFDVSDQTANALIGERCFYIAIADSFLNGDTLPMDKWFDTRWVPNKKQRLVMLKRLNAEWYKDMSVYVEYMNSIVKLYKTGFPLLPNSHEKYAENVKTLARLSELEDLTGVGNEEPNASNLYTYFYSKKNLEAIHRLAGHNSEKPNYVLEWALLQQLAETAIAIERYRLANLSLPQSLNQLVPQFLTTLPVDPYSEGKTLRYVAEANGKFMLSSIESDNKKPKHRHPAPDLYTFIVNPALRTR